MVSVGVFYLEESEEEADPSLRISHYHHPLEQYKLVKEALKERKIFLETAPHLSSMLP